MVTPHAPVKGSVVMGVFNGGWELAKRLWSVLTQQGVTLEWIVVDNGAKDGSGTVVDEATRSRSLSGTSAAVPPITLAATTVKTNPMPPKIPGLIAQLECAGFVDGGGKGSHRNFCIPTSKTIAVAGDPGDDAKRYLERAVQRAIAESRHEISWSLRKGR